MSKYTMGGFEFDEEASEITILPGNYRFHEPTKFGMVQDQRIENVDYSPLGERNPTGLEITLLPGTFLFTKPVKFSLIPGEGMEGIIYLGPREEGNGPQH